MQDKSKSIAYQITKFTPAEIRLLLRTSKPVIIQRGIEIRRAKKLNPQLARTLIVIPRTVGNAVERNLLRRQSKNIFYQEKLFTGNYDLLVFFKASKIKYTFDQLKSMLIDAMNKSTF